MLKGLCWPACSRQTGSSTPVIKRNVVAQSSQVQASLASQAAAVRRLLPRAVLSLLATGGSVSGLALPSSPEGRLLKAGEGYPLAPAGWQWLLTEQWAARLDLSQGDNTNMPCCRHGT